MYIFYFFLRGSQEDVSYNVPIVRETYSRIGCISMHCTVQYLFMHIRVFKGERGYLFLHIRVYEGECGFLFVHI